MAEAMQPYLIFKLEEQAYALELNSVERVIRSVALTVPPDAPPLLLGLLNLGGEMAPVLDIRARFGLPPRPMELEDRLIICTCGGRKLAFPVDVVEGVVSFASGGLDDPRQLMADPPKTLKGVGRQGLDTILVYDLAAVFAGYAAMPQTLDGGCPRS